MSVARDREETIRALERELQPLSPEILRIVHYHLGWTNAEGVAIARPVGKKHRGTLCLAGAEAARVPREWALPAAVAVELLNNFSFLHDDIMDGDRQRGHRPTAWVAFGVGPAILTGTALLNLGAQVLLASAAPGAVRAATLFMDTAATMLAGQARDIMTETPIDSTVADVLANIDQKTSSSFSLGASLGCALAGGAEETTSTLAAFGRSLGTAFQARNDILGVWGEPGQTGGRPVGFDLLAKRATLPVVAALGAGGTAAERLRTILSQDALRPDDVREAQALIEVNGGLDATIEIARSRLEHAAGLLRAGDFDEQGRKALLEIGSFALPEPELLARARSESRPLP